VGLIIIVLILGGSLLTRRGRKLGSTGGPGQHLAIDLGDKEGATITVPNGGVPGGGLESYTITVHEGGDVSPDGTLAAREAANDPGGVLVPPGPPTKPPTPNMGGNLGSG